MKKLAFFLILTACSGVPRDPEPVIRPQPGGEYCDAACHAMHDTLRKEDGGIGCSPLGDPVQLPDGGMMSCPDWCQSILDNGVYFDFQCIATKIGYCSEIDTVCNSEQPNE
jgi:hypothetical protein